MTAHAVGQHRNEAAVLLRAFERSCRRGGSWPQDGRILLMLACAARGREGR
jgi:hypothetical protein